MSISRWRTATWLLAGWCLLILLWVSVDRAGLAVCPLGKDRCGGGIARGPSQIVLAAIGLVGVAGLLALWSWDRHRSRRMVAVPTGTARIRTLVALSLIGVFAAAHLLLLAPMKDGPRCPRQIQLNTAMAYPFNCDSPEMLRLAHDPRRVLKANSVRQSRPGYVLLAAAMSRTLGPVFEFLGLNRAYGQTDAAYLPLVLINFAVVASTVALFAWLALRLGAPPWVVAALCAVLAVNQVTKAFYWTPHMQMFVLLVPVVTVLAVRWVWLAYPRPWQLVTLALGLGFGTLIYGSLVITIAAVALTLLARGWRRGLPLASMFSAAAAAPTLGWIALCNVVAGSYYNHESAKYRQFVWLIDAADAGWPRLRYQLASVTELTGRELMEVATIPLIVLGLLAVAAVAVGVRLGPTTSEDRATLVAIALAIACSVLFLLGIGFWANRLTFHIFPLLLLLIGWVAARVIASSHLAAKITTAGICALSGAAIIFELTSFGPYA